MGADVGWALEMLLQPLPSRRSGSVDSNITNCSYTHLQQQRLHGRRMGKEGTEGKNTLHGVKGSALVQEEELFSKILVRVHVRKLGFRIWRAWDILLVFYSNGTWVG
jgi:hypothetical protein